MEPSSVLYYVVQGMHPNNVPDKATAFTDYASASEYGMVLAERKSAPYIAVKKQVTVLGQTTFHKCWSIER